MSWNLIARDLSIYLPERSKVILQNFSIEIKEGDSVAILGPTGSGKTTFAYLLMDLLPPYMRVKGLFTSSKEAKLFKAGREKAMIFQDPHRALNPFLQVKAHLQALSKPFCRDQLKEVFLPTTDAFLKKYPHELSGGEKQRLMILMALSSRPQLLIADEPSASLDGPLKKDLLDLLKKLQEERGFTLVLLTHDAITLSTLAKRQVEIESFQERMV